MKITVFILIIFMFSFGDELRNLTNRGTSAFKKGDYEKALEYFNEAAQKYPTNNEARFNKGLALSAVGNAQEAEATLSGVRFDKDDKNAKVLYTRARIAEAVGDNMAGNEQQPNFAQAKKSYKKALSLYAQSLDLKKDKKTAGNMINLIKKVKELPEQEEQEQDKQDNKDNKDKNNDKNKQQDDEQNEQEQDKKQEQEQNEQNQEEQQEKEQQQAQDEEKNQDAMRLLEYYADDAKELNKPPVQKVVPAVSGKDW